MLDIGCNGGFYAMEMKRRGAARVVGVDFDEVSSSKPASPPRSRRLRSSSAVYRCTTSRLSAERFDIVLFVGVLYHLRHPLLALDLIHEHVAKRSVRVPVDATGQQSDPGKFSRITSSGSRRRSMTPAIRAAFHRAQLRA